MKTKTAQKIVAILLFSSLTLIVLSFLVSVIFPRQKTVAKPGKELKIQDSVSRQDLMLKEQSASETVNNSAGYKQWATDPVLPQVYQPEIENLVGRARDNKALTGVTVYLVLPPDGSLSLPVPSVKDKAQKSDSLKRGKEPLIGLPLKNTTPWYWNIEKILSDFKVKEQSADTASADASDKQNTAETKDKPDAADTDDKQNVADSDNNEQSEAGVRDKTNSEQAGQTENGQDQSDVTARDDDSGQTNSEADTTGEQQDPERRVERVIDEKTGETSLDPTATKAGDVTVSEISVADSVARETKARLESLGAEVVLIGGSEQALTEKQRAAAVANHVLKHFTDLLRKANISSERINQLKEKMVKAESYNIDAAELSELFPDKGVSKDLRLLLDIERQYTNNICVEFSVLDGNLEQRGTRIRWLGNLSDNGAQTISDSDPNQQPVYLNYGDAERLQLANKAASNISGLLPDMKSDNMVEQKAADFDRYTNLNTIDVVLGRLTNPIDGKILASSENCGVIAEALANSVFEFYNQER